MTTTIDEQLEIDHDRGVIYFHVKEESLKKYNPTLLRICRLPKPLMKTVSFIDLTHMIGCYYEFRTKSK